MDKKPLPSINAQDLEEDPSILSVEPSTSSMKPPVPADSAKWSKFGPFSSHRRKPPTSYNSQKCITPLPWSMFFQRSINAKIGNRCVRIYGSGSSDPVGPNPGTVIICLHGAGYSGLTWAAFTKQIIEEIECEIVAPDLRGHGATIAESEDLSMTTLIHDMEEIIEWIIQKRSITPNIVLIGHSMGGALATNVASESSVAKYITGLIVIDVVEGCALDALKHMRTVINNRPKRFSTITEANRWACSLSHNANTDAIRVSMPGQLKNERTGELATYAVSDESTSGNNKDDTMKPGAKKVKNLFTLKLGSPCIPDDISENDIVEQVRRPPISRITLPLEIDSGGSGDAEPSREEQLLPRKISTFTEKEKTEEKDQYVWRVDLLKTEPFWKNWFTHMSERFLNCTAPRLILLCHVERLDTPLLLGQMQGKFQMGIIRCGHAIQEEKTEELINEVSTFLSRRKLVQLKSKDI